MNSYQNFIIQLTVDKTTEDKNRDKKGLPKTLLACVIGYGSPVGHQNQSEATPVDLPAGLVEQLERLKFRQLDLEELIALGEQLSKLLLPRSLVGETRRSVRDFYHLSRAKLKPEEGLRIQIRAEHASLGNLPWEYIYVANPNSPPSRKGHEGFLALDREISIVRYENYDDPKKIAARGQDKLRVTVLLSEGEMLGWPGLNLDKEEDDFRQVFEGAEGTDLNILRPGTLGKFEDWITASDGADVFHFSGHGQFDEDTEGSTAGAGSLILTGDDGSAVPMEAEKLAAELSGRGIRLAVLGACEAAERDMETPWSGVASALVAKGIPAVIGMRYTVFDHSAIAFSRRLYQALVAGKSIDSAVSEGRLGIYQRGGSSERDWGVPVLYMRTNNNVLFPKREKAIYQNLLLFAAASLALTWWFFAHVYDLLNYTIAAWAGVLGIGTALPAAIAVGQKVLSMVKGTWHSQEQVSWFETYLRHPSAPAVLGSYLVVSLVLLFTTYSMYLTVDATDPNTLGVYEIAVTLPGSEDKAWRKFPNLSTDLSMGKTQDGGFVLFQFFPPELDLNVSRPYGLELDSNSGNSYKFKFFRNQSIKLEAPSAFIDDGSRPMRLILRTSLQNNLTKPGSNCNEYRECSEIWIKIDDNIIKHPLHQGIIYFGTHQSILEEKLNAEWEYERSEGFRLCMAANERDDKSLGEAMDVWKPNSRAFQQFIPDAILGKEATVTVEIWDYLLEDDGSKNYAKKPIDLNARIAGEDAALEYEQFKQDRFNNICMYKVEK